MVSSNRLVLCRVSTSDPTTSSMAVTIAGVGVGEWNNWTTTKVSNYAVGMFSCGNFSFSLATNEVSIYIGTCSYQMQ